MAFRSSIAHWIGLVCRPEIAVQKINVAGAAISLGPFWPGNPRAGYVRIKANMVDATCQCKVGYITATNGTNVSNIHRGDRSIRPAGDMLDVNYQFHLDWQATYINLNVWNFGNTNVSTYDVEVIGWR